MKMVSKCICLCIFINLFSFHYVIGSYSVCGNWQSYKDEKCIKIFDTEKLVTFDDAMKSCPQIDNSSQMLTIHSKEEQDFISEYLFKTHKLVDNVWIGFRNKSKSFEWTDSSNKQYMNWRSGYPSNKTDTNCVLMESDGYQWTNEPCNKKNLAVCQKLPEVTLSDLLKQLLETKERLKQTEEGLNKSIQDNKETKEDLRVTKEEVKVTRNEKNEIFNVVFNNKVSHYQLFTDTNGKNKAFIIPLSAMRNTYTFDDSVNLCKNLNSTLIEIQSLEKQIILESFLGRLGFESQHFKYFWINGERDSTGKWKWIESNTQFNFTNWNAGEPATISGYNNIYVYTTTSDFGKWGDNQKTDSLYVLCEHTFDFSFNTTKL